MKNQIKRFLMDERGDGLNDLFLLIVLIATAIFAVIMMGVALTVVIGLIIGLVFYIKYLCKLWKKGKKGWVWIGLIPLVAILFASASGINYIRMAPVREKQAAEQYKAELEQARTEFRLKMQQLPISGYQFEVVERASGIDYGIALDLSQDMIDISNKYSGGLASPIPESEFVLLPPETWTFNGQTFEQFSEANPLACGTNAEGGSTWAFAGIGTYGKRRFYVRYPPVISITTNESLKEVCIRVSNLSGSVEKLVCVSCHYP